MRRPPFIPSYTSPWSQSCFRIHHPRLDVAVVERGVRVVHVHPVGDALRQVLPRLDVAHHALAAARVEAVDAVRLDLLLAGQPQLLLHLQLHGQAVRVPPALADDVVAPHGLVAGDDVLEHPRQDVVDARRAVGRGRALVEHEQGLLLVHLPAPLVLRTTKDVAFPARTPAPRSSISGKLTWLPTGRKAGLAPDCCLLCRTVIVSPVDLCLRPKKKPVPRKGRALNARAYHPS